MTNIKKNRTRFYQITKKSKFFQILFKMLKESSLPKKHKIEKKKEQIIQGKTQLKLTQNISQS